MKSPERFSHFRTLAEFWREIELSSPGFGEQDRALQKSVFMGGAIASWMLARKAAELETGEALALWKAFTAEIEEYTSTAVVAAADIDRADQTIADANTEFFEREMLPLAQQLARMAKGRGISMLAGFEITTGPKSAQFAHLLLPGPGGRVSDVFAQALGILNGTSPEEALRGVSGNAAPGRALH